MVAAAVMLFYVSYWLLTKVEVAKWNSFVKAKVQDAVSSGSAFAPRRAWRSSRCIARASRRCSSTRRCCSRADRQPVPGPGGHGCRVAGAGGRLRGDQPVRRAASAPAVLHRHQLVPLLHGVRVRREGSRGAAGRRPDRHHERAVGAADSRRSASIRRSSRCWPRPRWCCSRSLAILWIFVIAPARERRRQRAARAPARRPRSWCGHWSGSTRTWRRRARSWTGCAIGSRCSQSRSSESRSE